MYSPIHFNFESSAFPPVPGEDEETNPNIFGRALSEWLAEQLRTKGFEVKRLVAEDFGRLIEVVHPGCKLYVAMANTDQVGAEWRVFTFSEFGFIARLRGLPSGAEAIAELMAALKKILAASSQIRNLSEEAA
jgi:hypothetical protein